MRIATTGRITTTRAACGLAAGFLMLLAAAGTAFAGAAEKRELIVELLETTHMLDTIERLRDQVLVQTEEQLKAADPAVDPRAVRIVQEVVSEEYEKLTQATLSWSAEFMFRHYSEAEVRELIAFYRTEAGRKTIDLLPRMTMEMSTALREKMAEMPARIQAKIAERVRAQGLKL